MSFLVEEEIECLACKYPNKVEVWSVVNVKEDPELKDILLGGELNMAECVSCKQVFYAEHFIIYHESDRELMAFVYPFSYRGEADKWREKTAVDFENFQKDGAATGTVRLTYKPLTLFGLDELVQLVQKEEEMNVQADIVRALADEEALKLKTLAPARARELKVPTVLPLVNGDKTENGELVRLGLEKLLQINPRLYVYRELLDNINNGQHVRLEL